MFHDIPERILDRMKYLEERNQRDRVDGTPTKTRLRQIPPETGRFIALLCTMAPAGQCLEIGTSAGYSTLWLVLACLSSGRHITTFEILDEKITLAQETFKVTGVNDKVQLIHGDARTYLADYKKVAFCFLDAEKDVYQDCYEMVVPNMVPGGVLVADNVISHESVLKPMVNYVLQDTRVDALIVTIGSGLLVCRRI
jgi:caffeoyl-CoA O-methyltransferase